MSTYTSSKSGKPMIVRHHDSLAELVHRVETGTQRAWIADHAASRQTGNYHKSMTMPDGTELWMPWHGTDSWADALAIAKTGWRDVRGVFESTIESIQTNVADSAVPTYTYGYDVAGSDIDIERYSVGDPECMRECFIVPGRSRVVRVGVQVVVSAGVSPIDIVKRGAAVLGLIELFRRLGIGVELFAFHAISGWANVVRVARASEPLDIDDCAFAIAHPAMSRRLGFAVQELETERDAKRLKVNGGYHGDTNGFGYDWGDVPRELLAQYELDVFVGQTRNAESKLFGQIPYGMSAEEWVRKCCEGLDITLD